MQKNFIFPLAFCRNRAIIVRQSFPRPLDGVAEVCSKCHPFYTGKQKLVDSGGRVERFNKRFGRK